MDRQWFKLLVVSAIFCVGIEAQGQETLPSVAAPSLEEQMHITGVPECLFDEAREHIVAGGNGFQFTPKRKRPFRELSASDQRLFLREMAETMTMTFGKLEPSVIVYVGRSPMEEGSKETFPVFFAFFRADDGKTCLFGGPLVVSPPVLNEMSKDYE